MDIKTEKITHPKYDDLTDLEKDIGIPVANYFKTLLGTPKIEHRKAYRGKDGEIRVTLSYCKLPIGWVQVTTIDGIEVKTYHPEM